MSANCFSIACSYALLLLGVAVKDVVKGMVEEGEIGRKVEGEVGRKVEDESKKIGDRR